MPPVQRRPELQFETSTGTQRWTLWKWCRRPATSVTRTASTMDGGSLADDFYRKAGMDFVEAEVQAHCFHRMEHAEAVEVALFIG